MALFLFVYGLVLIFSLGLFQLIVQGHFQWKEITAWPHFLHQEVVHDINLSPSTLSFEHTNRMYSEGSLLFEARQLIVRAGASTVSCLVLDML